MPLYGSGSAPKTEYLIDGVWTDLSTKPRASNKIVITRGRANEQGRVAAQTANFTADNRDGALTNRNPNSAYFRKLPRNTQVRVSAGAGDNHLRTSMDYSTDTADRASTPDVAALDVVGDIELRMDLWPMSWRPKEAQILAAKYAIAGNQRSWFIALTARGYLRISWSPDGTSASRIAMDSTVPVPATSGRLSVKLTLDVVNGANKSAAFYTSDSIDGTYTQLGATVTTAGTTSIFSSTARVTIGQGDDNGAIFTDTDPYRGKVYKFRMYSGIGGTVVANPDFTAATLGAASFADSTGKTWTVGGKTRITTDRLRFWGELAAPPIISDTSGKDINIPVTAAGPLRRLLQGGASINSPLYRAFISRAGLTGYMPLEDSNGVSSPANVVSGARPGSIVSGSFSAGDGSLPGSKANATLTSATGKIIMNAITSPDTKTWYFSCYFKIPALPASLSTLITLNCTAASPTRITIGISPIAYYFDFIGPDNISIGSSNVSFGAGMNPAGQWIAMNVLVTEIAFVTNYYARWSNVAAQTFVGIGPVILPGSIGRISKVTVSAAASANFVDTEVAHIVTATSDLNFVDPNLALAANAYLLETAGNRLKRLAAEEDIALEIIGDPAATEQMGYQSNGTITDLLFECVDVDMGIMGESRDSLALQYRTRADLGPRADLTLSYSGTQLSQEIVPTEDDAGITNDVTVQRTGGSSGRREITTGYMSVSDPPTGIGRYTSASTLNAGSDLRLNDLASWLANRGSVDQYRVPKIAAALHRAQILANSDLTARLIAANLGDTLVLTGLPAWLPPDDVPLLMQGYTETLDKFLWDIAWNTTPAELYTIGRYDYETVIGLSRYDHATSTTAGSFNASATSFTVALNSSTPVTLDRWTVSAGSFPFDIMVAGERMTVTNITGTTSPQTFTVTRSVNGIIRAHVAGERVRLFRPSYWRL